MHWQPTATNSGVDGWATGQLDGLNPNSQRAKEPKETPLVSLSQDLSA